MFKNVASQKVEVFAFDYSTGAPKTGDSANITVYVAKDDGSTTALTDTSATEKDSTNAKGWYIFDVSQTETNADKLHFTGKSSTANITVVGRVIYTRPAYFSSLSIDSNGRPYSAQLKRRNTAQAGAASTITLDASAGVAHCQAGDLIYIESGTGAGNSNYVSSYNNTTKVATMIQAWGTAGNPDNSSVFQVWAMGGTVPALVTDVWSDSTNPSREVTAANLTEVLGQSLSTTGNASDDSGVFTV